MKKFSINVLLLLTLLLSTFWVLDYTFTTVYKRGDYTKVQWLYNMHNEDFDFAVHGSSRAFTTINVGEIDSYTDLRGVNISVDGSSITDQYLMLKIFIENNNKVKHLYLQVDPWSTNSEEISEFAIPKFFPYLKERVVFDHFKQFGIKWYAYRYIPFLRYAEYNTIWGPHQLLNEAFDLFPQDFDQYGCYFYKEVNYRGETALQKMEFELNGGFKFLNQIIDLCKEKNIALTLFTSPIANIRIDEAYKSNMSVFKNMMNKKGVEYINYGSIYGNEKSFFTDEIHLNKFGVEDFTNRIQDLLINDFSTIGNINITSN